MRFFVLLACVFALAAPLAACGKKGPLDPPKPEKEREENVLPSMK